MDKLFGVLQTVIPVLLMIAVGVLCKQKKIISRQGITGLKTFVFYITLPFVVFKAFYNTEYNVDMIIIATAVFLVTAILLYLGFLYKRITKSPMHTTPFLMTGFEAGMLGFALYSLLFGSDKISYFATVDLGHELFIFIVFMTLLLPKDTKHGVVKGTLKRMFTTPLIIAVFIGIIVGATGLGNLIYTSAVGETVEYILEFISAPTAAIILLVVGYELEFKEMNFKAIFALVFTRILVVAAISIGLIVALSAIIPVNEYLKWAFILLFILPPPFAIPILLNNEKENAYVSAGLSVYTIFSLIAFAFITISIA